MLHGKEILLNFATEGYTKIERILINTLKFQRLMKTSNILQVFGKTVTSYDGWNGDHNSITVSKISFNEESNEIIFSGIHRSWGREMSIYIPKDKAEELLEKGKASVDYTIDHCSITKEWQIL